MALEVVVAALKERKSVEKERFSKAFSGPSLYAEEEARAAKTVADAARKAAEEEVALTKQCGWCWSLTSHGRPRSSRLSSHTAWCADMKPSSRAVAPAEPWCMHGLQRLIKERQERLLGCSNRLTLCVRTQGEKSAPDCVAKRE